MILSPSAVIVEVPLSNHVSVLLQSYSGTENPDAWKEELTLSVKEKDSKL